MAGKTAFNAGVGLGECGVDREWLTALMPRIDPTTIEVRQAPRWFMALWARGIVAVAMPWAIYLTPAMMQRYNAGAEPQRMGTLLVHELAHIEQVKRLGVVRHVLQYVSDYLRARLRGRRHWDAYRQIRLEVEARSIAQLVMAGPQ